MCFLLILLTKHSSLKTCACTILYLDKYHILTTCVMKPCCEAGVQTYCSFWATCDVFFLRPKLIYRLVLVWQVLEIDLNPSLTLPRWAGVTYFFFTGHLYGTVYCIRGQTFCQHTAQLAIVLPLRCPCELRGQISSKGLFANIVLIKKRVTLDYWLHVMIQVSDFHRLVW